MRVITNNFFYNFKTHENVRKFIIFVIILYRVIKQTGGKYFTLYKLK